VFKLFLELVSRAFNFPRLLILRQSRLRVQFLTTTSKKYFYQVPSLKELVTGSSLVTNTFVNRIRFQVSNIWSRVQVSPPTLCVNRNIDINSAAFIKMSGGRNNGRGGSGRGGRGGRRRGRGQNYTGSANAASKGMCPNLGTNVFDYGQKSAADQMRTSWEKLAQYVGTNYGQDISNELQNNITVILVEPVHTDDLLLKHGLRETMIRNGQMNIQRARKAHETILDATVLAGKDMEAPMKIALLQNKISQILSQH
jgi:hypothetical protein